MLGARPVPAHVGHTRSGASAVLVDEGTMVEIGAKVAGSKIELQSQPVPGATIRIELKAYPDQGTLLVITNPFAKVLSYRAVADFGDGDARPTSVCPILPKAQSIERWPEHVTRVGLEQWTLADAPGECH
jgi:hypothetical protein